MSLAEIPRPAGSLISHSLRFVRNTMVFYEDAFRECGDIFTTRIPGLGHWVYVCSPELARALYEAPPEVVAGGDSVGFNLAHLLGHGAASHFDGAAHRERRHLTARYLDTQAALRHLDEIRAITLRRIASWPLGKAFPLVLELQRIALEALLSVIFSGASPATVQRLADRYQHFSFKSLRAPVSVHPSLQIDLGPWSPWGRVKRQQRELIKEFLLEIDSRLAKVGEPDAGDLVSGLARARLADGSRLPREVILAEILDLLFQGHELTGDSMTWTMAELLRNPEAVARLRHELDTAIGEAGVQSAQLAGLPYLEAVVYEGMRRRPSNLATTVRRIKQPFRLGAYLLPAGTLVALCYPAVAMREDLFPHSHDFDPQRFYGTQPPSGACPFGGGPHICAGRELAMVVMKVALATIVRQTELRLAQQEVRPVRNAYFYEPNQGLLVTLESRRS